MCLPDIAYIKAARVQYAFCTAAFKLLLVRHFFHICCWTHAMCEIVVGALPSPRWMWNVKPCSPRRRQVWCTWQAFIHQQNWQSSKKFLRVGKASFSNLWKKTLFDNFHVSRTHCFFSGYAEIFRIWWKEVEILSLLVWEVSVTRGWIANNIGTKTKPWHYPVRWKTSGGVGLPFRKNISKWDEN